MATAPANSNSPDPADFARALAEAAGTTSQAVVDLIVKIEQMTGALSNARNQAITTGLALKFDPDYGKLIQDTQRIGQENQRLISIIRQKGALQDRQDRFSSGQYAQEFRQNQTLARQELELQRMEVAKQLRMSMGASAGMQFLQRWGGSSGTLNAAASIVGAGPGGSPEEIQRYQQDEDKLREAQRQLATLGQIRDVELELREVRNGTYRQQLKQADVIGRQVGEVEKLKQAEQLRHRYGERVGGLAARYGDTARRVGGAAQGVAESIAARGKSAVIGGFQDTVEWNRLNFEISRTSRELANAFAPALRDVTSLIKGVGDWLRELTPGQQKALRIGGEVLMGGLVANKIAKATTGMGLGSLGLEAYNRLRGAAPKGDAIVGAGRRIAVDLGTQTAASAITAPRLSAAEAKRAADEAAQKAAKQSTNSAITGGVTGATAPSLLSRFGRLGGAIAARVFASEDIGLGSDYAKERAKGGSVLGSLWRGQPGIDTGEGSEYAEQRKKGETMLGALWESATGPTKEEREKQKKDALTASGGGFSEVGSSYYRISEEIAQGGGGSDSKEGVNLLAKILGQLQKNQEQPQKPDLPDKPLNRPGRDTLD